MRSALLLPCLVLAACGQPAGRAAPVAAADPSPRLEIPRLAGCVVDGSDADWGAAGLRITAFAEDGPAPVDPADLGAAVRLAWTVDGLAVLAELRSRVAWVESAEARTAYEADSIELFLRRGSQWRLLVQPVIAPGMADGQPEPRVHVWDYRGAVAEWAGLPTEARVARQRIDGGCRVEVLIPWRQLRFEAAPGGEVEFRCNINKVLPGAGRRQLVWRTVDGADFQRLVLGTTAAPAIARAAWVAKGAGGVPVCAAVAPASSAGEEFAVERDGVVLATTRLRAGSARAEACLGLPGLSPGPLRLLVGGQPAGAGVVADAVADARRAVERAIQPLRMHMLFRGDPAMRPRVPAILQAGPLPQPAIADLATARLAGLTGMEVRWFDAGGARVEAAAAPGRYGAEITLRFADGTVRTVHQTAVLPAAPPAARTVLPGWSDALATAAAADPQSALCLQRLAALPRPEDAHPDAAILLAAAHEAAADGQPLRPWSRDAAWWYALRTRLGTATTYAWARRLPAGYDDDATRRWPAIIYLHGSGGEIPSDYGDAAKRIAKAGESDLLGWLAGNPRPFAAYALLASGSWEPQAVAEAVDRILAQDRIDPDRVVVMGFSMGGIGTWDCATELPGRWAAAVPIGGRGYRAAEVARLGRLPVWAFNGDADPVTTLADARSACDALQAAGGDVRLTVLPGVDHGGSQNGTFATPGLWEWLAERRR